MDDRELISAAIKASGLSVRAFARDVLTRDPRTVWRWLAGSTPLPIRVRERCETLLSDAGERVEAVARLTDAELDAQMAAGTAAEERERAAGLRAESARYDRLAKRVVLELTNGVAFAFAIGVVPGLEHATEEQCAALELSPSGSGVLWDALDADISVPGVLMMAASGRLTSPPSLG